MKFKTLKQKSSDLFGHISEETNEIYTSQIPVLQPLTATMENMINFYLALRKPGIIDYLTTYDLIEVELLTIHL